MKSMWTLCGGVFAFLAVALGAFGAHGLRSHLSPELLDVFKTGAQYQMTHALALLVIGFRKESRGNARLLDWSGGLMSAGIVLFSGSLYVLATTNNALWGAVTPLGGLCFLSGWILFIVSVLLEKRVTAARL